MPRARNIKPGFFKNEKLAALPFEARLLFIGLWTLADREGRLEDRPARIKAELFPYEAVDCDFLLGALAASGFIEQYSVGEGKYLQILNFLKHQKPHVREVPSEIPPSPIQAVPKHNLGDAQAQPRRSDSLLLIPDSPLLNPGHVSVLPDFDPNELPKPTKGAHKHAVLLAVRERSGNPLIDWISATTRAQRPNEEAVNVAEVDRMVRVYGQENVIAEFVAVGGAYLSVARDQVNRNLAKRYPEKSAARAVPVPITRDFSDFEDVE